MTVFYSNYLTAVKNTLKQYIVKMIITITIHWHKQQQVNPVDQCLTHKPRNWTAYQKNCQNRKVFAWHPDDSKWRCQVDLIRENTAQCAVPVQKAVSILRHRPNHFERWENPEVLKQTSVQRQFGIRARVLSEILDQGHLGDLLGQKQHFEFCPEINWTPV